MEIEKYIYYREDKLNYQFKLQYNGKKYYKSSRNLSVVLDERDRVMKALHINPEVLARFKQKNPKEIKITLVTLKEAFSYWTDNIKQYSVSMSSMSQYHKALRLVEALWERRLIYLKSADWNDLWLSLLKDKGLSYNYVVKQYKIFKAMYSYYIMKGHIKESPLDDIFLLKLKPMGVITTEKRVFDDFERDAFLEKANEKYPGLWYKYFKLLFSTGIRRGEAVGLKWGDINLDDGMITVQRTISKGIKDDKYIEYESMTTKTKKPRIIPADKELLESLYELRGEREDNDYVFYSTGRSKYPWISLAICNRFFNRILKAADLDQALTIHSIRHYVCTKLETAGVSAATLRAIGGWSTDRMIKNVYSHGTLEAMKEGLLLLK